MSVIDINLKNFDEISNLVDNPDRFHMVLEKAISGTVGLAIAKPNKESGMGFHVRYSDQGDIKTLLSVYVSAKYIKKQDTLADIHITLSGSPHVEREVAPYSDMVLGVYQENGLNYVRNESAYDNLFDEMIEVSEIYLEKCFEIHLRNLSGYYLTDFVNTYKNTGENVVLPLPKGIPNIIADNIIGKYIRQESGGYVMTDEYYEQVVSWF